MNFQSIVLYLLFCLAKDIFSIQAPGLLRADSIEVEGYAHSLENEPPLSHTKLSYKTLNKLGFDVVDDTIIRESWLIQDLAAFAKDLRRPLLDVGGGYGGLTRLLLEKGATLIYNDIKREHLLFGRKKIPAENYSRLYLNTQSFPNEMNFPLGCLDGVILHRVLHFMDATHIENGLSKAYQWLAPKGKIFIVVLAPQHPNYKDKILEIYERSWGQGDPWPGYGLKAEEGFISVQRFRGEGNGDGQEAYGIIGIKEQN